MMASSESRRDGPRRDVVTATAHDYTGHAQLVSFVCVPAAMWFELCVG